MSNGPPSPPAPQDHLLQGSLEAAVFHGGPVAPPIQQGFERLSKLLRCFLPSLFSFRNSDLDPEDRIILGEKCGGVPGMLQLNFHPLDPSPQDHLWCNTPLPHAYQLMGLLLT